MSRKSVVRLTDRPGITSAVYRGRYTTKQHNIICATVRRNPGGDISFPIFTRKEVETKRIGIEIKTIISRLNDLSSFLSNIEQNRN